MAALQLWKQNNYVRRKPLTSKDILSPSPDTLVTGFVIRLQLDEDVTLGPTSRPCEVKLKKYLIKIVKDMQGHKISMRSNKFDKLWLLQPLPKYCCILMRDYTSTSPLSYTSAFRKNTWAKRKQCYLYNQQRRVICTNITNHGVHTTASKSIRVVASLQNTHFSWEFEHFWKVNDQKHSTPTNLAFLPHICVHQQSILFEDWPHENTKVAPKEPLL